MQISFNLAGACTLPAVELERARRERIQRYRKLDWDTARCDKHGEPIRVTLSPVVSADGSIRFVGKELFCCQEFEQQIALEWDKYLGSRCCPDGPVFGVPD